MNKTIAALATPTAHSAIAVVRLSGENAIEIADSIFKPSYIGSLCELAGYRAAHGRIIAGGKTLDEAVALVFRAPKSYTGENMVELSCHGNPLIAARVVAACIEAGAAPAGAGEFTRRAFENGKIDLSQAEAVAELIEAESGLAASAALDRREGGLGRMAGEISDSLSYTAAKLAVWSDYPDEEDAPAVTREELVEEFAAAAARLEGLISGYRAGSLIQNGVRIAVAGSPNVGKSTLTNLLSGSERSIVTDIAGTTRDVVEAPAELDGIALRLLDTAGIRETDDAVEKIGVSRAREAVEQSDLVLFVIDASRGVTAEDEELFGQLKNRPHLVVYNKNDLVSGSFQQQIKADVEISAATGEGVGMLRQMIKNALGLNLSQDSRLIASQRQFDCLSRAKKALDEAVLRLREGVTLDVVGILLDDAVAPLAELVGKSVSEAVLEQVFANFCVGK